MKSRIEAALELALQDVDRDAPPRLRAALHHAVFPGGARVRPRLCLAVADACGGEPSELAVATGAALELLHCASLAHDDLPCFDDADLRRGRPSVHRAYGVSTAVLAGDALILKAFEVVAKAGHVAPHRLPALMTLLAEAAGPARGLVAGQAWEAEPEVDVAKYHQAKTGALFVAATR
ncbi:MAG: polyprenyl synthetase family protein, partial [Myxococcota bacterium]